MLLALLQKAVVHNDSPGLCADIFSQVGLRRPHNHPARIIEHRHAQIDAVVGKVLVVRSHSKVALDKALYVYGRRVSQNFRLEIPYILFSDCVDFFLLQNRDSVLLGSVRGRVHKLLLPLPLFQLGNKLHPLLLSRIQVTGGAEGGGYILPLHDVAREVRRHGITLSSCQVKHSRFFVF